MVRAVEIEVAGEEDVVIPRSFRWLAVVVAVPVELMIMYWILVLFMVVCRMG